MSRPRQILPNTFYMITRRCTQRQFLLRPDAETNNAFAYCLGEAAQRFDIEIILPMAESNHHHTNVFDRHGRLPEFMEHLHKMLARCMNARWGRWENFWAAEEVCATRLLGFEAVMEKLVYAATNPVKDFLVDKAWEWPGVNGYRNLIQNEPLRARRPRHFFRAGGVMPDEVTLELTIPPELGDRDAVIADLRERVRAVEESIRDQRLRAGRRVFGRRRVTEQSWRDAPTSVEPRRTLRPRFAGPAPERLAALVSYKEFLATYDHVRRAWRRGEEACFPAGSYWVARFTPATVVRLTN